jgi:hypothetical protein
LSKGIVQKEDFPFHCGFQGNCQCRWYGVPDSDVTLEDVKAAKVIWGLSVLKMKGNTVRRNGKKVVQSIIKVTTELIKLHQDVKLAIEVFLSTDISSLHFIAQRSASPHSLIWHTMRKNISGKLSW